MFVVVARYTTSQNVRATPTRLSPPWNTIAYVLPPLPWNLNKGKNEYTCSSLHKVVFNAYLEASAFLSLSGKPWNDTALFLI